MTRQSVFVFGALLLLLFTGTAVAGVIINPNVDGILWKVSPNRPSITGADMAGMHVVASYSDGHDSATAVWKATGADSGQAELAGWFRLTESGDTFGGSWVLTNLRPGIDLIDLHLIGGAGLGGVVFDRTEPSPGTFDTARGWDLALVGGDDAKYNVVVQYINLVGNPALRDAYWKIDLVSILLAGGATGIATNDTLTFIQDTDKFIPEPGTYILIGAGLALLGWFGKRQ